MTIYNKQKTGDFNVDFTHVVLEPFSANVPDGIFTPIPLINFTLISTLKEIL